MSKRNKFFVGLLVATLVIAFVVTGDPKFLLIIPVLLLLSWLALRIFVFLWQLFAPIREAAKPLDDHLKSSLDRAGLGAVSNLAKRIDQGVERAVAVTQQGIDERRKT